MIDRRRSKRIRERLELRLPVRVHCRETADFEWSELTRLVDVTPFGAGFTLKRPTERGRLLHMTIPMPRQLRVFDHVEDQYRVWALVRYMRAVAAFDNKPEQFDIGVAFVGKRPPASYEVDPSRRYQIAGESTERGLPSLMEQDEHAARPDEEDPSHRPHTRHTIPVALTLEVIDEKGEFSQAENTVTENISRNGATVFTSLNLPVGRFVKLASPEYGITVQAVVRGRSTAGAMPRIHVEFVDRQWPIE
jgi:hypothetical protein